MGKTIGMSKLFLVGLFILLGSTQAAADGHKSGGATRRRLPAAPNLPVPITLLTSAVDKGAVCIDGTPPAYHIDPGFGAGKNKLMDAVCIDGTPPAYHIDPGFGAGKNRWIIDLEGGGWCDSVAGCLYRKASHLGSSNLMDKQMYFVGILSSSPVDNPDFYSWNRVMIRYCDGASFAGEGYDAGNRLYFRGQRIFNAAIQYFLSIGMASADQVLLTGISAGALAVVLHCDQFNAFFAGRGTTVKCLADAGLFLDAVDVSGGRTLRSYYGRVIATHGVAQNLPKSCTARLDATSCFFPQNIIGSINTPIFLLNAAYDTWQIRESLAPDVADHNGTWRACKSNRLACDASQITFLQAFRGQMVATVQGFSGSKQSNGFFINSCFIHGQSENHATWNANGSPTIQNKDIGKSVGDWYFGRAEVKAIDCPYPCDNTCHHDI